MSGRHCVVCGGTSWTTLPDPGPRSMASDFRIVDEPLARVACNTCGLARRDPKSDATSFYESGYELYAHAPGESRERARQAEYARWIVDVVTAQPERVLDIGCGNGSLLRALRDFWPDADLCGCDPSAEAIAHGAVAGVRLWRGTLDDVPADVMTDLVVTVNVIEHTPDPLRFLERIRERVTRGGRLVVVCPDGSHPGVELLFADHLFSFAAPHLEWLVQRAAFDVIATSVAPPALGQFQMVVGRRLDAARPLPRVAFHPVGRDAFLERWRELDERLLARLRPPVVCFGAGEAAGLLRAYAPRSWSLVTACTMDAVSGGTFGDLPIVALESVATSGTVLLGVRPADQPGIAERLRARFPHVVAWYDLVNVEHH